MTPQKSGGKVVETRAVSRLVDGVLYIDVAVRLEPLNEWINITVVPDLSAPPDHRHEWETMLWPRLILKCPCGARQTVSAGRGD